MHLRVNQVSGTKTLHFSSIPTKQIETRLAKEERHVMSEYLKNQEEVGGIKS